MGNQITRIRIARMYESCERTTFYVNVESDEGFEMTVASHRTGSIYTNHEGLSEEDARDRALTDAADWGDFLGIAPEPYLSDGKAIEPKLAFNRFETRRILAQRRATETKGDRPMEDR